MFLMIIVVGHWFEKTAAGLTSYGSNPSNKGRRFLALTRPLLVTQFLACTPGVAFYRWTSKMPKIRSLGRW